jgi:hypothetical protein
VNELGQGLAISGLGILITFSALGILIGLIMLLKRLFPVREQGTLPSQIEPEVAPDSALSREDLRKLAAAAGVGTLIQATQRSGQGNLGKLLEDPAGEWWKKGLDRAQGKE